jgi:L-alanine-DL-glutamate epimerase-like enolase superfamily enzyme
MNPDRRVASLEIVPVGIHLTERFAIANGAPSTAKNVFARVILEDGTVGYGEAAPFEEVSGETQDDTLMAMRRAAELIIGTDVASWRSCSASIKSIIPNYPAARSALEQSLLDSFARHLNISLLHLFGGAAGPLTTDITITASDVEHARLGARRAADSGFSSMKVKVGGYQGWRCDVERIAAVVDEAPEVKLIVDANGAFSMADASLFLDELQRRGVGLALFEQPVAPEVRNGLGEIERLHGVPVCADESVRNPVDAIRISSDKYGASVWNIKIMKLGVLGAMEVMAIARASGKSCMIGGMIESAVAMSFSTALAMANRDLFGYVDLDTPLFMNEPRIAGGMMYDKAHIFLDHTRPGTGVDASALF